MVRKVLLTADEAAEFAAVASEHQATYPRRAQPRPTQTTWPGVHHEFVAITSLTQTAGRYPGKIRNYSTAANTWSDGATIWVVTPNGETLGLTTQYEGRLYGAVSGVAVFMAIVPGTGAASSFPPGVCVTNSGRQATSTGLYHGMTFDTVTYDTATAFTAPGTFVLGPGLWVIGANLSMEAKAYTSLNLQIDGLHTQGGLTIAVNSLAGGYYLSVTTEVAGNNSYAVNVLQNSGGAANVLGEGSPDYVPCRFWAYQVLGGVNAGKSLTDQGATFLTDQTGRLLIEG